MDASLIQADANKQRSVPGHEWNVADIPANACQAVKDYLATLDDAAFGAAIRRPSGPASRRYIDKRDALAGGILDDIAARNALGGPRRLEAAGH